MTHPIYDSRPPIFCDRYDGEHDDEMGEQYDLFLAFLDLTAVAVFETGNPDKKALKLAEAADAILLMEPPWGDDPELFVRATAIKKWFRRPLDRFLVLYYLWRFGIHRETAPEFYSAFPPRVSLLDLKPASYFIFDWHALLQLRFDDRAKKMIKAKGTVPKLARSNRDVALAKAILAEA